MNKNKPMKRNMNEWQQLVAKVREWDRREHNWQLGTMRTKNLVTKNDFIHSLMKQFKLTKRKAK